MKHELAFVWPLRSFGVCQKQISKCWQSESLCLPMAISIKVSLIQQKLEIELKNTDVSTTML